MHLLLQAAVVVAPMWVVVEALEGILSRQACLSLSERLTQ
jgi:hypothetical protein